MNADNVIAAARLLLGGMLANADTVDKWRFAKLREALEEYDKFVPWSDSADEWGTTGYEKEETVQVRGQYLPYEAGASCEEKCKALVKALFVPEVTWEDYASLPAPVFDGKSARQMIDEGRCEGVLEALWMLYTGAFL